MAHIEDGCIVLRTFFIRITLLYLSTFNFSHTKFAASNSNFY